MNNKHDRMVAKISRLILAYLVRQPVRHQGMNQTRQRAKAGTHSPVAALSTRLEVLSAQEDPWHINNHLR